MVPTNSLRHCAWLSLLLLAGCGSGDSAKPPELQVPPPFKDSGPPDDVCVTKNPEPAGLAGVLVSAPPGQGAAETPPPPQGDAMLAATATASAAVLSDPLGEPIALAADSTGLVAGTLYNTAAWPVWWGTGKAVGAVNCLASATWHKHMLISIYSNGKRLGFPDGIGRVHAGCYHAYEMHVHDVTGIVHMEADTPKNFKLGDWFQLWQQPLGRDGAAGLPGPVRFYIIENGTIKRWDSNPADIPMVAHREILIVAGTPLATVPRYTWPLGI